jgi:hypothetical protein
MKKASRSTASGRKAAPRRIPDELRPHYDFTGGVRGKYAKRVARDTNVVVLDADIAAEFRSDRAVNRALRDYLRKKLR